MAGVARAIFTKLGFKVDATGVVRFNEQVGRTKKEMNAAGRALQKGKRQFNAFAFAAKAAVATFIAGRIIRSVTVDYAGAADAIAKMSKATGLQIETYQGLIHAGKLSGLTQEEVNKALTQLPKRANDAANGIKKMKDAYADLGVEVTDADGELRNADDLLLDVADGLKNMENRTKASALAQDLLGRSGAKLLVMFDEGSDGIRKMIKEKQSLGDVFGKKAAAEAEKFNDELLRATSVAKGIRNQIARRLLPAITKQLTAFRMWAQEGDNVERALTKVKIAAMVLVPVFAALATAKIVAQFVLLKGAIISLIFWLKSLGVQALLAQAKLLLIPIAIIALLAVLDDLWGFLQGKDSAFGRLFGTNTKLVDEFRAAFAELGEALVELWDALRPLFVGLLDAFRPLVKALLDLVRPLLPSFTSVGEIIGFLILKPLIIMAKVLTLIVRLLINVIEDGLKPAAALLGGVISTVLNWILGIVQTIGREFKEFWLDALDAIGSALRGIGGIFLWIFGLASRVADAIKGVFVAAWQAIADAFPGPAAAIEKVWNGLVSAAKTAWGKIKGFASEAAGVAKGIWSTVAGGISSAFSAASGAARDAWAATKRLFEKREELTFSDTEEAAKANVEGLKILNAAPVSNRPPGAAPSPAAVASTFAGAHQTYETNVAAVHVAVAGSVDMTAPEFKSSVKQGTQEALQEVLNAAARDRKPATAT